MEIENNAQRSVVPDVCRGIAIFLVVWGHILQRGLSGISDINENVIFKIIYSFHMPLFILISGFFFCGSQKRKELKGLVFDRVRLLLRILFIWNTVCYVCKYILAFVQGTESSFFVKGWIDELLRGYWFLWAILFFTIIVGIVCKVFARRWWLLGCVLLAPVMLISPCRWVMLSIYPFYLAGFFYSVRTDEGKPCFTKIKYVTIALFVIGTVFYLSHSAVENSEIKGLLDVGICMLRKEVGVTELMVQILRVCLYYFLGFVGSIATIVVVELMVKKNPSAKIVNQISELGKYSLQIYILQRVIIEILLGEVCSELGRLTGSVPAFTYVYSFLISCVCVVIVFCIAKYGIRGKLRNVLFGR